MAGPALVGVGVTLPTAPVVVGGGRGVGSADGSAPLEELAELLGGRVGCSRAVTNNGWRPTPTRSARPAPDRPGDRSLRLQVGQRIQLVVATPRDGGGS